MQELMYNAQPTDPESICAYELQSHKYIIF